MDFEQFKKGANTMGLVLAKYRFRKRYKVFFARFYYRQGKPISTKTFYDEERNFVMFLN